VSASRIRRGKNETLDAFYRGRIRLLQSRTGYRFSVDAPLLADFVRVPRGGTALELGAGCGVVSLLVALRPVRSLTALEVQPRLARLAARNARLNGMEKKVHVVRGDLRTFAVRRKFDVVFSNPPYIERGSGFPSPVGEKNIAKHEIKCDIIDVMNAAARFLKKNGRAFFIFPVRRRAAFLRATRLGGLRVRRERFVLPRRGAPAHLFLAECGRGPGRGRLETPLALLEADGSPAAEAERVFSGARRG